MTSPIRKERRALALGEVVGQRYRLGRPLGRGGMGTVYLAHHITTGGPVAVKVLNPKRTDDPRARRRFELEARNAGVRGSSSRALAEGAGIGPRSELGRLLRSR